MLKMTTKKMVLSLFPFFLLFFFANLANAQDDFAAATLPSVELCPCSNQAYAVTVQNTGSAANSYTAAAGGDAAGAQRTGRLSKRSGDLNEIFASRLPHAACFSPELQTQAQP